MSPVGDPATAPPRTDLPFLKRRSKPRPAPSTVADFITGRAPHPQHGRAGSGAPAATSDLDLSAPATPPAPAPGPAPAAPSAPPAPSSLDLSAPPTPAAPAPPTSSPLDLSRPARPSAPAPPSAPPAGSSSLDLSAAPVARPAQPPRPAPPRQRVHSDLRVRAGQQQLLSITAPTVTLTRVQSGVGQLEIEAVCSAEVGDLRLGAAYQLAGGVSSTVQYAGGNRFAPSSRRPLIVAGRDEYENLRLDLRQVRNLERLAVYAFSESRAELAWGGTLVVTTFGGARIELPLETLFTGKVAVLMSIYNLDGELVVRAEMETITGDVREAARAYGYDRITWRDDRNPVDL